MPSLTARNYDAKECAIQTLKPIFKKYIENYSNFHTSIETCLYVHIENYDPCSQRPNGDAKKIAKLDERPHINKGLLSLRCPALLVGIMVLNLHFQMSMTLMFDDSKTEVSWTPAVAG